MDELFSLFIIDGDPVQWADDPTVPYLKYQGLTWSKAVELCRLSFNEGYTAIIWKLDADKTARGEDDGKESE
jgi:hypothetical protein